MKKYLVLVALLAAGGVSTAFGQTEQGKKVLAGSLGGGYGTSDYTSGNISTSTKNRGISVAPSLGYFIKDNLEAGASVGYSYSKSNIDSDESASSFSNTLSFSPYIRKYFPIVDNFFFHGTGSVSVLHSSYVDESNNSSNKNKSSGISVGVSPGLTYFVSNRFAINTTFGHLGYSRYTNRFETGPKSINNSFSFNLSLSTISFGLSYFMNR